MASSTITTPFKFATLTRSSVSIGANNTRDAFSMTVPNDVHKILSATMINSPNPDWVICRPYITSDTTLVVRAKNEYTSALSGNLEVAIIYL